MKSRILCNHAYHTVEFHDDGTVTSTGAKNKKGCGDITAQSRRLGAAIRLGKRCSLGGCIALAALVNHGIHVFLNRDPGKDGYLDLGAWDKLYTRFESNKIVEITMAETRRKRDAAHINTFAKARAAFASCGYDGGYDLKVDQMLQFMPDLAMKTGRLVALTRRSVWTIPLQPGWLESISQAGIATVSKKLVCGIDEKDPHHVWAVAPADDGIAFVLREFHLQTKPQKRLRIAA